MVISGDSKGIGLESNPLEKDWSYSFAVTARQLEKLDSCRLHSKEFILNY